MHPLPKEYAIAGKNGSVACIVSFHVARSIPIGQARLQVGSIVEELYARYIREEGLEKEWITYQIVDYN